MNIFRKTFMLALLQLFLFACIAVAQESEQLRTSRREILVNIRDGLRAKLDGNREKAKSLITDAYSKSLQTFGASDRWTIQAFASSVEFFTSREEFDEAYEVCETLIKEAKKLELFDNGTLNFEAVQKFLAVTDLCSKLGFEFDQIELLKVGLKKIESTLGVLAPETIQFRDKLVFPLIGQGDFKLLAQLMRRNSKIQKQQNGDDSKEYLRAMQNLGVALNGLNQKDDAIKIWHQCIETSMMLKDRDWHDQFCLGCLSQTAGSLAEQGATQQAVEIYHEVLASKIAEIGEEHNNTKLTKAALGKLFAELGNETEAEKYIRAGIGLNVEASSAAAVFLARIGKVVEAESILQPHNQFTSSLSLTLGSASPEVYFLADKGGLALTDQGNRLRSLNRLAFARLSRLLPENRDRFIDMSFRPIIEKSLSMAVELTESGEHSYSQREFFEWGLNSKAISSRLLWEAYRSDSPEAIQIKKQLELVAAQISVRSNTFKSQNANAIKENNELTEVRDQLEKELTAIVRPFQTWNTATDFKKALADDECFVSISKFRFFDFELSQKSLTDKWQPERYVAWIVRNRGSFNVQCVDLGLAKPIDDLIRHIVQSLADTPTQLRTEGDVALEAEFRKELLQLSHLLYEPLRAHVGDAEELIVSPDDQLWLLPWEILQVDGKYLVESKRIRYLPSGRELLRDAGAGQTNTTPVIFANPNYEFRMPKSKDLETASDRGNPRFRFKKLAYSEGEAMAIAPSIQRLSAQQPKILLEGDAREASFKALQRPKILAISTHGYFSTDQEITNPLLRCGLALAGANNRSHKIAESGEDGILTGLEIVGTDLRGTELVVLSACETGVGEIAPGEDVAGLRHAFQLAGADSVLSSLWQVEDGETARLMKLFFENLAAGKSKSEALRQAQLTRIAARRARHGAAHPFFWAAFTLTGQD